MTVISKNLSFALLAMTTTTAMSLLILAIVQNASATSSEIRMLADLNPPNGGLADGRADYRERGNSVRLNVEVEDVSPNSTFTVEISGAPIGTIRTNSFGIGEIEQNTNDGQVVPKMLKGDLVQIFQGIELVLSGGFDDDDGGNMEDDNPAPITPAQNNTVMQAGNSSAIITVVTIPQDADERGASGAYSPNPASVTSGSTMTWNNIDNSPHTATADDGSFDTGIINGGSSGSALISASNGTRTIPYHCNVHPVMRGTLQVNSLSSVPSSNSTLQNTTVTVTNISTDATIQNLQQEVLALQQAIDSLQQSLMALQQSVLQERNSTSADNNNTAASSIQEERQQQPALPLPPQQPQSHQQGQQQNQTVLIVQRASTLTNTGFQPNPIHVQVGDMVTWINDDLESHTVTSGSNGVSDNKFNSSPNFIPLMAPDATFSHTFAELGKYPYFCLLHPNMVGTVSVIS